MEAAAAQVAVAAALRRALAAASLAESVAAVWGAVLARAVAPVAAAGAAVVAALQVVGKPAPAAMACGVAPARSANALYWLVPVVCSVLLNVLANALPSSAMACVRCVDAV